MAFLPLQVNKRLKLTALCLTLSANFSSQKNKPQTVKPYKKSQVDAQDRFDKRLKNYTLLRGKH